MRRRRAISLGLIVVVGGWVTWEAARAITATPATVVDYAERLTTACAERQPDGEDGWPDVVAAVAVVRAYEDGLEREYDDEDMLRGLDASRLLDRASDDVDLSRERALLDRIDAADVRAHLDAIVAAPRFVHPVETEPPVANAMLSFDVSALNQLSKALAGAMRRAADAGDDAARLRAFETALALARACAQQPMITEELLAMSIAARCLEELRRELVEHRIDAATARALLGAIDRQDRWPPPDFRVRCEHLVYLDLVQWAFTDDGHGAGALRSDRADALMLTDGEFEPGTAGARLDALRHADRREAIERGTAIFEALAEESRRSIRERVTASSGIADEIAVLESRHPLLALIAPATVKLLHQRSRIDAEFAATRAMLVIEAHRATHGALPATLDAIDPPADLDLPIDPIAGAPFGYRALDDDPHGRDYLLYSVGIDRVDDTRDAPIDDVDASAQPEHAEFEKGADIGFVTPRREPRR